VPSPSQDADGLAEVGGPAISQIIAGDGSYDDVTQMQFPDGLKQAPRFIVVNGLRPPRAEVAKATTAGADVSQDQKGGCPMRPTAAQIGAAGGLTDGLQVEALHQISQAAGNRISGLGMT
jgi:hypothetical protein